MFFVDVETADGAATCAALMARKISPCLVSRIMKDGITSTRIGFASSAEKLAQELKSSPEFAGAAYAFHLVLEAKKLVPNIYTELPNGNAMLVSADLPREQICALFNKAMSV